MIARSRAWDGDEVVEVGRGERLTVMRDAPATGSLAIGVPLARSC